MTKMKSHNEITDDEIMAQMKERYGKEHTIARVFTSDLTVDLTTLEDNQAVVYGDGKTYYFLLTKRDY